MSRRQTVQSAAALDKLLVLDQEAAQFDAALATFRAALNSEDRTLEGLLETRNACRQWSGNLEKFQYVKVDSIITAELTTGKEEAKMKRKTLNKHCEELRVEMEGFISEIEGVIAELKKLAE